MITIYVLAAFQLQECETISHLLLDCFFTKESSCCLLLRRDGWHRMTGADWWIRVKKLVANQFRQALDSLIILTSWMIWILERTNNRTFSNQSMNAAHLVDLIVDEGSNHQYYKHTQNLAHTPCLILLTNS